MYGKVAGKKQWPENFFVNETACNLLIDECGLLQTVEDHPTTDYDLRDK